MKQEEILKQISSLQDQLNNLAKEVNKPKEDNLIGKCFKLKHETQDKLYIILDNEKLDNGEYHNKALYIANFKGDYSFYNVYIRTKEIIEDFEEIPSSTFMDKYKEAIRSISNTIDNALKEK